MGSFFRAANPLASCDAPRGRCALFTLDSVDRVDEPGGRVPGPPGRPAAHYLSATAAGECAFKDLFAADSSFVLYSIEQPASDAPFVVFLSLPPDERRKMWQEEAFIDRGIRKLVAAGSRVAVASLATAADYAQPALDSFASGAWQCSFVWNTGRCGSTLLHKAVSAMGTASFSEPHWLDQLHFNKLGAPHLQAALRVCVALEALTARLQTAVPGWARPTNFVFNPKAGGMKVAEAVVSAFPGARHAFMYRACHKVVESFCGLKLSHGISTRDALLWRLLGMRVFELLPMPNRPDLPVAELSSMHVASMTSRWVTQISEWLATTAQRAEAHGADDPLAAAIVLRMDEFTSKDLGVRGALVRRALTHFGVVADGVADDVLRPALEVFSVHSQSGSKMSGPKAKVVTPDDVDVIKRCVTQAFGYHGIVEQDGANVALPRSLGIVAS